MKTFMIKGNYYGDKCFPGLNDLFHEAERHPTAYNNMKRKFMGIAVNAIRQYLKGYTAKGKVIPHYKFGEPKKGKVRDYDNIQSAARKIINDALVKTKTIIDDSPQYLECGTNEFEYTDIPYIRVDIEELEN